MALIHIISCQCGRARTLSSLHTGQTGWGSCWSIWASWLSGTWWTHLCPLFTPSWNSFTFVSVTVILTSVLPTRHEGPGGKWLNLVCWCQQILGILQTPNKQVWNQNTSLVKFQDYLCWKTGKLVNSGWFKEKQYHPAIFLLAWGLGTWEWQLYTVSVR